MDDFKEIDHKVMQILAKDAMFNERMRLGESDSNLSQSDWSFTRHFLNWGLWITLYNESWIFRRVIDKPAEDMVGPIEIKSTADPAILEKVMRYYENDMTALTFGLKQGRIFGGAAGLMLIDGQLDEDSLKERIDYNKVKKNARMSIYTRDRWNGLEWTGTAMDIEDIGTTDFGKHKMYNFLVDSPGNVADGNKKHLKAHHTHVLRFGNRIPPKFVQYQLSGWDLPEGQHIMTELTRDETTRAAVATLIAKAVLEVVQMEGAQGLFSGLAGGNGNEDTAASNAQMNQIYAKLTMMTRYKNLNSVVFLDKEDKYSQFQVANLSGIADVLDKQQDNVAGAAEIPRVILYGETKGGIGSDQPAELVIYAENINNKQNAVLRPVLNKLLPVYFKRAGAEMPEDTTFTFLPIYEKTDKDKSEQAAKLVGSLNELLDRDLILPSNYMREVMTHSKMLSFGTTFDKDVIVRLEKMEKSGEYVGSSFKEENELGDKGVVEDAKNKKGNIVVDTTTKGRNFILKRVKSRSK